MNKLALVLAVCAAALRAQPPEIVALTSAFPGERFASAIAPVPPALVDSMRRTTWHEGCPVAPRDLRRVEIAYWGFDGKPARGVLVIHRDLAAEVASIFGEFFAHGFLIERMEPIENFAGDDDRSMQANNTSAFNCRDATSKPGVFSNHSWGRAIDINPLTNPYVKGEKVLPPRGRAYLDRAKAAPGSILDRSFAVQAFEKRGWTWGGRWKDRQDYQHFEKPDAPR